MNTLSDAPLAFINIYDRLTTSPLLPLTPTRPDHLLLGSVGDQLAGERCIIQLWRHRTQSLWNWFKALEWLVILEMGWNSTCSTWCPFTLHAEYIYFPLPSPAHPPSTHTHRLIWDCSFRGYFHTSDWMCAHHTSKNTVSFGSAEAALIPTRNPKPLPSPAFP